MRTGTRVAGYLAGLVVVFAGALGIGSLVGGDSVAATPPTHQTGDPGHGEDDHSQVRPTAAGLAISADGYTLQPLDGVTAGQQADYRFRILSHDGRPVTDFAVEHEKQLHLIVVNRDLSGFQHLHPVLAADGTWSVPLLIERPGAYRVIADFKASGASAGAVLGADLLVPGTVHTVALPAVSTTAQVDGYTITLSGSLTPESASPVSLRISRGGSEITDLQPYLGVSGHLVALRQGDVGYLHVHPSGSGSGPRIDFVAEVPSAGTYRLYLDFKHGDVVRTAEFTVTAGGAG